MLSKWMAVFDGISKKTLYVVFTRDDSGLYIDPDIIGMYMGVSKNRGGPPKWMVKIMEPLFLMDD